MTRIATVSGRVIDFLYPDPEQINLDDIARGLSRQARYSGQTIRPYTVAQHSLLVASLVAPEHRLYALLHDAPEAYLGDIPSPAKDAMDNLAAPALLESPYRVVERRIWRAICNRYDLSPELPDEVHEADQFALVIEAPILQPMGWKHAVWDGAREAEKQVSGAHREQLLKIMALPDGGYATFLWDATAEIAKRRAA